MRFRLHLHVALFFALALVVQAGVRPAAAAERRTPVVEAVARAGPAVVNIRTERIIKRRSSPFFGFGDSFFEEFFREYVPPRVYTTQSLGSGVVIDAEGHILTNAHVIEKASKIFVALPGQTKEIEAKLVGKDGRIDLAVLRLETEGEAPFLPPARSDDLLLGETVIAIGNPLGLGHSITTGIVSSSRRRIALGNDDFSVFIQTDALINPGNSGGPLININGELIGINTAIAQQAQGIGFAIPIDTAKRVLYDLIEYGRVRKVYTGIIPAPVGRAFAESRGAGGVLVKEVDPGSPAAAAGLRTADVVLTIAGVEVESLAQLNSLLGTYTPDDRIEVGLLRGTRELSLTLQLAALPEGYALDRALKVFGFSIAEGGGGVRVDEIVPGSPAAEIGLEPGDLVMEVAGVRIETLADFRELMEELIGHEPLRFLFVRGGRGYYVDLP